MSMLVESLGCPEDSAGCCWWWWFWLLLLCSFPLKWWQHRHCFFDTCDSKSVTTASKGSEKTSVLQTFPVCGLDMLEAVDKGAHLPGWFLATTYKSIDSLTGCKYQDKSPAHKVEEQNIKVPAKQTPGLRTNLQEHHVASIRHEIIKPFVSCIQQLQLYHRTPGCRRFVNACPEQFVLCLRHVESCAPRTKIQGGWTRNQRKAPGSGTLWCKICQIDGIAWRFRCPKVNTYLQQKKEETFCQKGFWIC